jgi:hypothetical protein
MRTKVLRALAMAGDAPLTGADRTGSVTGKGCGLIVDGYNDDDSAGLLRSRVSL